jgi:hypothetical protein
MFRSGIESSSFRTVVHQIRASHETCRTVRSSGEKKASMADGSR